MSSGTLACFQVGANDAETLALQLGGGLTAEDLLRLPRYRAYIRLLIDGHDSTAVSGNRVTVTSTGIKAVNLGLTAGYHQFGTYGCAVNGPPLGRVLLRNTG